MADPDRESLEESTTSNISRGLSAPEINAGAECEGKSLHMPESLSEDVISLLEDKDESDRASLHDASNAGGSSIIDSVPNIESDQNCMETDVCSVDSTSSPHVFTQDLNILLRAAIEEGHCTKVGNLLKLGANVNDISLDGLSPLHSAIILNHYKIAEMLISSNANVNAPSSEGIAPLFYSVEKDDFNLTELLLKNGANVNITNPSCFERNTPLHIAVKMKYYKLAELLISFKADVNALNGNGRPPLYLAIGLENLDLKMTQLLLDNGANVKEFPEVFPLAVMFGSVEIAEALLLHGAEINSKCGLRDGSTGLRAVVDNYCKVILCSRLHGVPATEVASIANLHLPMIDLLLKYNADVNLANYAGYTPLHCSAQSGNVEITSMLLSNGANVSAKSNDGSTPLSLAILSNDFNSEEVVKLLLENGAKVNCRDGSGSTPLLLATKWGLPEVIDALLTYGGGCVNSIIDDGETALHISSKYVGYAKTVSTLLEHGADVNMKGKRSYTPLNYAWGIFHTTAFREEYNQNPSMARPHPRRDIIDLLYRHQVKLEAVGFKNTGCSAKSRSEEGLDSFYSDCKLEITRMKSEFIGDSDMTYYGILSKDSSFVANFMKSRSVEPTSELEDCKSKFPINAGIIRSKIRKGWVRGKLLEKASLVFNRLRGWPKDCTDKVLDFLENDDLRVLAEV